MELRVNKEFEADLIEAFEYWCTKTGNKEVTLDQWIAALLRKPVYDLVGEKRVVIS